MNRTCHPLVLRLSAGLCLAVAAAAIAGCSMRTDNIDLDWTPQQKAEWVRTGRAECKPHGHALDAASGGYTVMREVLLCPNGTLRIVPLSRKPNADGKPY